MVASGGEDDICYIWDLESGEVKQKLTDFKDSVTHVKFNHDGSYLAVADMSGLIKVLKVLPNLDREPVWSFETGDMSWLDWHPGANVLFAGTADSSFWMWKIPSEYFFFSQTLKKSMQMGFIKSTIVDSPLKLMVRVRERESERLLEGE